MAQPFLLPSVATASAHAARPSSQADVPGSLYAQLLRANEFIRIEETQGRKELATAWVMEQYAQSIQSRLLVSSSAASSSSSPQQQLLHDLHTSVAESAALLRSAPHSHDTWDEMALRWNKENTAMPGELLQSLLSQCEKPEEDSDSESDADHQQQNEEAGVAVDSTIAQALRHAFAPESQSDSVSLRDL